MDAQPSREFKGFKVLVGRTGPVAIPSAPSPAPLFAFSPDYRERRIRREVEELFREANRWRRTG